MRRFLIGLSNAIHLVVRHVAVAAVVVMFATVMLQVVARYVFSAPPIWTEDVARYMMVWTGLLGATLSFKTRSDAVLLESVFPDRPHPLGFLAEAVQSAAVLIFLGPVLYFCFIGLNGGFAKGYLARQAGLTVDTLGIPMVWIAAAVPLAAIVILIHLAARWAGEAGQAPANGTCLSTDAVGIAPGKLNGRRRDRRRSYSRSKETPWASGRAVE